MIVAAVEWLKRKIWRSKNATMDGLRAVYVNAKTVEERFMLGAVAIAAAMLFEYIEPRGSYLDRRRVDHLPQPCTCLARGEWCDHNEAEDA